jgi:hypothetical protein
MRRPLGALRSALPVTYAAVVLAILWPLWVGGRRAAR